MDSTFKNLTSLEKLSTLLNHIDALTVEAKRNLPPSTLTLYHGTAKEKLDSIKAQGLINRQQSAGWYMLADNEEDAIFHSKSSSEYPILITFTIPCTNERWEGEPHLWPPADAGHGKWYAPRDILSSEFITDVRDISKEEVSNATLGSKVTASVAFHGTSIDNANNIMENGFITGKEVGMSNTPNEVFIFVSPSKGTAEYFAKDNSRIQEPAVVEVEVVGNIYDLNKSVPDYKAFGLISDILGARPENPTMEGEYDEKLIAETLKAKGYVGFSFKDSNANNRLAYAVLPEVLKPVKVTALEKTAKIVIEVEEGDTILTGHWRNHKEVVRDIGKTETGMPTINGREILKFRLPKKADKETSVFLGGECDSDNMWRDNLKGINDALNLIDPFDEDWVAEENIYEELADMVNSDEVIFYKGGEGTEKEKEFLDSIDKEYTEFDNLKEIEEFLKDIDNNETDKKAAFDSEKFPGGWITPLGEYIDTNGKEHKNFLIEDILKIDSKNLSVGEQSWREYAHDNGYGRFRINQWGNGEAVLEFGKLEQVNIAALETGMNKIKEAVWDGNSAQIEFFGSSPAVYSIGSKRDFGQVKRDIYSKLEGVTANKVTAILKVLAEHSHGCLYISVPQELSNYILKEIAPQIDENILDKEKDETLFGVETQTHCTLFYPMDICPETLPEFKPFKVTVDKIDYFDNEDNSVAIIPIESPELQELHKQIAEAFPTIKETWKEYRPHITIAYLKPKKRLADNIKIKPYTFEVTTIEHSAKDGKITVL